MSYYEQILLLPQLCYLFPVLKLQFQRYTFSMFLPIYVFKVVYCRFVVCGKGSSLTEMETPHDPISPDVTQLWMSTNDTKHTYSIYQVGSVQWSVVSEKTYGFSNRRYIQILTRIMYIILLLLLTLSHLHTFSYASIQQTIFVKDVLKREIVHCKHFLPLFTHFVFNFR